MEFFEWDDGFSVYVVEIDRHHQHLFVLREQETVAAAIKKLIDYASYHFTTEEAYMRRWAYPEHSQHHDEHRQFIENVQAFKQAFDRKKTRLSLDIAEFAKSWWRSHILGTDKKCGAFLNEQGLR